MRTDIYACKFHAKATAFKPAQGCAKISHLKVSDGTRIIWTVIPLRRSAAVWQSFRTNNKN